MVTLTYLNNKASANCRQGKRGWIYFLFFAGLAINCLFTNPSERRLFTSPSLLDDERSDSNKDASLPSAQQRTQNLPLLQKGISFLLDLPLRLHDVPGMHV
jgi:hypothetical protein